MKKKNRIFGKVLMVLMIAFFYVPRHMLESQDMMTALYTTFSIAILATMIATVVGTVGGYRTVQLQESDPQSHGTGEQSSDDESGDCNRNRVYAAVYHF